MSQQRYDLSKKCETKVHQHKSWYKTLYRRSIINIFFSSICTRVCEHTCLLLILLETGPFIYPASFSICLLSLLRLRNQWKCKYIFHHGHIIISEGWAACRAGTLLADACRQGRWWSSWCLTVPANSDEVLSLHADAPSRRLFRCQTHSHCCVNAARLHPAAAPGPLRDPCPGQDPSLRGPSVLQTPAVLCGGATDAAAATGGWRRRTGQTGSKLDTSTSSTSGWDFRNKTTFRFFGRLTVLVISWRYFYFHIHFRL